MADINDIKGIVLSTIGNVADKTKEVAFKTADKAKNLARIAKLSVEVNVERDKIKKLYTEIGKLYYETHKDNPDGFFVQLCDEVSAATDSISAKEDEIADLKASVPDFDEGDFEDLGFSDDDFEQECGEDACECGCCGTHAPEAEAEVEVEIEIDIPAEE